MVIRARKHRWSCRSTEYDGFYLHVDEIDDVELVDGEDSANVHVLGLIDDGDSL